jgi:hypothetical protein
LLLRQPRLQLSLLRLLLRNLLRLQGLLLRQLGCLLRLSALLSWWHQLNRPPRSIRAGGAGRTVGPWRTPVQTCRTAPAQLAMIGNPTGLPFE